MGPAPAKAVFEAVAVPLASPWTRGVAWRGLRTVAFDGLNSVKVPDSDRNRCWLGKTMTRLGLAGYPAMRIVALAETGTRGLLGAVIGGTGERAEVPLARKLVPLPPSPLPGKFPVSSTTRSSRITPMPPPPTPIGTPPIGEPPRFAP